MSKKIITLLAALSIVLVPIHSYATTGGGDGPSEQAEKNASDNASFKRDQKDKKENKDKDKEKKDKKKKDKSDKSDKYKDQGK